MKCRLTLTFASIVLIAMALVACTGSDGVLSGTAEVQVMVTDAPSDYIASADVTFSRVYLKADDDDVDMDNGDGAGDVDLLADGSDPVTYDLMLLRDGIEALLADAMVPEGTYHQLRMVVQSATVTLVDEDTEGKVKYRIVGETEASVKEGKISITSPIARALLGKRKKDVVEVSTPGGGKSYEIIRVEFK